MDFYASVLFFFAKGGLNVRKRIPDLIVLYNKRWAMLECKKDKTAPYRPNQKFYLDKTNRMSFSATIYPENKDEILGSLVQYLKGGNYEI